MEKRSKTSFADWEETFRPRTVFFSASQREAVGLQFGNSLNGKKEERKKIFQRHRSLLFPYLAGGGGEIVAVG